MKCVPGSGAARILQGQPAMKGRNAVWVNLDQVNMCPPQEEECSQR